MAAGRGRGGVSVIVVAVLVLPLAFVAGWGQCAGRVLEAMNHRMDDLPVSDDLVEFMEEEAFPALLPGTRFRSWLLGRHEQRRWPFDRRRTPGGVA